MVRMICSFKAEISANVAPVKCNIFRSPRRTPDEQNLRFFTCNCECTVFLTEKASEWQDAILRFKGQINQNLPYPSPRLQRLLASILLVLPPFVPFPRLPKGIDGRAKTKTEKSIRLSCPFHITSISWWNINLHMSCTVVALTIAHNTFKSSKST